jgi:hypothetical protein
MAAPDGAIDAGAIARDIASDPDLRAADAAIGAAGAPDARLLAHYAGHLAHLRVGTAADLRGAVARAGGRWPGFCRRLEAAAGGGVRGRPAKRGGAMLHLGYFLLAAAGDADALVDYIRMRRGIMMEAAARGMAGIILAAYAAEMRPDEETRGGDPEDAVQVGGVKVAAAKPDPCPALGAPTGETARCPTCRGVVHLKVFACGVFGACTLGTRAPGVKGCCEGCGERPKEGIGRQPGAM